MKTSRYRLVPTLLLVVLLGAGTTAAQQPRRPLAGQPRDPGARQEAPIGTATISGSVLVAGTGQPARKARVNLSGAELRGNRSTTTDDQGRFSFTALPAGRFTLSASKPGHITVSYGQRRPGAQGTPIQLGDGQKFDAQLQIPRGGVVTGTILDEHGEATPGTQVRAMRFVTQNGERTTQTAGSGSTDDRGIYRIYGLQPGDYMVCATPRNAGLAGIDALRGEMQTLSETLRNLAAEGAGAAPRRAAVEARLAAVQQMLPQQQDQAQTGYAPVCYPGTTSAPEALPIALGIGEERLGVNFQLQLVPMARVEGTVINSTDSEIRNVQLRLQSPLQIGLPVNNSARADGEGRFQFTAVPPGQYRLTARAIVATPGAPGARGRGAANPLVAGRGGRGAAQRAQQIALWASADIVVDGSNLANVMLSLQHGMTVSGQVKFEGTRLPPPADLTRIRVAVAPVGDREAIGGASMTNLDASGNFTIEGVPPGRYRLTATGAQGWTTESAVVGGVDALDFPFEVKPNQAIGGVTVTMTDQQTELSGMVVNASNQPETAYTLVIFPADERYWSSPRRIRTTRPGTDGRYLLRNLPPGDYKLATVVDVEAGAASDPAFLQQLDAVALSLTLNPGERKMQDIRMGQ